MCVQLSSLLRFNSKHLQVFYYFTIFEYCSFIYLFVIIKKRWQAFLLLYFKSTPSWRSVLVRKLVSCKVTENPFSYVYLELSNLEIEWALYFIYTHCSSSLIQIIRIQKQWSTSCWLKILCLWLVLFHLSLSTSPYIPKVELQHWAQ